MALDAIAYVLAKKAYEAIQQIVIDISNKAPIYHASASTQYGVGSNTLCGHVKIDNALSTTSTNTVQNSIVTTALNTKANTADVPVQVTITYKGSGG